MGPTLVMGVGQTGAVLKMGMPHPFHSLHTLSQIAFRGLPPLLPSILVCPLATLLLWAALAYLKSSYRFCTPCLDSLVSSQADALAQWEDIREGDLTAPANSNFYEKYPALSRSETSK